MNIKRKGMWLWLWQRISAVLLLAGLLVHFVYLHYSIERPITMAKVALRLSSPCWILFDCLLLMAALYHALAGCYNIFKDYGPSAGLQRGALWMFWIIGLGASIVGVFNLLPFGG